MCTFELVILCSFGKCPVMCLLDHRVVLCHFLKKFQTVFQRGAPVCIPNRARGFLLLHILTSTCFLCFDFSHFDRCEVISHCSLICISIIMNDVEFLSYVFWPSVCLLWRNVCSCILPIFTF